MVGVGRYVKMLKYEVGAGLGIGTSGLRFSCSVGDVGLRIIGEI